MTYNFQLLRSLLYYLTLLLRRILNHLLNLFGLLQSFPLRLEQSGICRFRLVALTAADD
jgi:hypothetical protein